MKKIYFLALLLMNLVCFRASALVFEVEVINNKFVPQNIVIEQGDSVMWTFYDAGQTTTSGLGCQADSVWDSGIMDTFETFMVVFDSSGNYPYFSTPRCLQGMVGEVRVKAKDVSILENRFYTTGSFNLFPNPAASTSGAVTLEFSLEKTADIKIQLMDVSGKLMQELIPANAGPGPNKIRIQTDALPQGIYLVRLLTEGIPVETKMLIRH